MHEYFLLILWLPELRIRVQTAVPLVWQLVAVNSVREFAPFQTGVTLYPVLIRFFSETIGDRYQTS